MGAPFRRPEVQRREGSTTLQLLNGIYLQNIDIYIDTDPGREGYGVCIPGRRVAFADGRTWKSAVVLTPQPGPARGIAADALAKAASHVVFPDGLQIRGRTVIARVPAMALGGPLRKEWGYSVHVSGADWDRSFGVTDRVRGTREANAFTMPVLPVPERWAFGGAPEGSAHPRVLDVLLPAGANQKAVLGSFDESSGAFAKVPFVYAVPPGAIPAAQASVVAAQLAATPGAATSSAKPEASPAWSVEYIAGNLVSILGPTTGLRPMQFGRVLGPDGALLGRVVIVQVLDTGIVASAVEGHDGIIRGARIRFDTEPKK